MMLLGQKPMKKTGRRVVSGLFGLFILLALVFVGGDARNAFHLSIPGPVIGLVLLAAGFLLVERFHSRSHQHLKLHVVPVSGLAASQAAEMGDGPAAFAAIGIGLNGLLTALIAPLAASIFK